MTLEELVAVRVEHMFHDLDLSCVHTTLKILSEVYETEVGQQIYDASAPMAGGGGCYGGQCGLIQGGVMFIGILSTQRGLDKEACDKHAFDYSAQSEKELGSLLCREIRPEGFADDNPPNLCEPRTVTSIVSTARFIADRFGLVPKLPE
jgi:hypothetical protein